MEDMTLRKGLQLAVKTEQMGADYYQKLAGKFTDNEEIAAVFAQLSKDEKVHEAQFNKILETVPKNIDDSEYEMDQYTRSIVISEFFRTEEMKSIDNVSTIEEALGKALAFEKSTLLLYMTLKDALGDSIQLDSIINAEKEHISRLSRIIITDAQFRGIRDNW